MVSGAGMAFRLVEGHADVLLACQPAEITNASDQSTCASDSLPLADSIQCELPTSVPVRLRSLTTPSLDPSPDRSLPMMAPVELVMMTRSTDGELEHVARTLRVPSAAVCRRVCSGWGTCRFTTVGEGSEGRGTAKKHKGWGEVKRAERKGSA